MEFLIELLIDLIIEGSSLVKNSMLKRYVQPSDVKPAADTYTKAEWL